MAVYVDDNYKRPSSALRLMKMSHMVADTEEELHRMADLLGCKREWFQGDHYDVPLFRRKRAVENGAIEITVREAVEVRRRFRQASMGTTMQVRMD